MAAPRQDGQAVFRRPGLLRTTPLRGRGAHLISAAGKMHTDLKDTALEHPLCASFNTETLNTDFESALTVLVLPRASDRLTTG